MTNPAMGGNTGPPSENFPMRFRGVHSIERRHRKTVRCQSRGKSLSVLRENTERLEALEAGVARFWRRAGRLAGKADRADRRRDTRRFDVGSGEGGRWWMTRRVHQSRC